MPSQTNNRTDGTYKKREKTQPFKGDITQKDRILELFMTKFEKICTIRERINDYDISLNISLKNGRDIGESKYQRMKEELISFFCDISSFLDLFVSSTFPRGELNTNFVEMICNEVGCLFKSLDSLISSLASQAPGSQDIQKTNKNAELEPLIAIGNLEVFELSNNQEGPIEVITDNEYVFFLNNQLTHECSMSPKDLSGSTNLLICSVNGFQSAANDIPANKMSSEPNTSIFPYSYFKFCEGFETAVNNIPANQTNSELNTSLSWHSVWIPKVRIPSEPWLYAINSRFCLPKTSNSQDAQKTNTKAKQEPSQKTISNPEVFESSNIHEEPINVITNYLYVFFQNNQLTHECSMAPNYMPGSTNLSICSVNGFGSQYIENRYIDDLAHNIYRMIINTKSFEFRDNEKKLIGFLRQHLPEMIAHLYNTNDIPCPYDVEIISDKEFFSTNEKQYANNQKTQINNQEYQISKISPSDFSEKMIKDIFYKLKSQDEFPSHLNFIEKVGVVNSSAIPQTVLQGIRSLNHIQIIYSPWIVSIILFMIGRGEIN